ERQQPPVAGREHIEVAKLVSRAIEAVPWRTNCLERSLVVSWVAGESSVVRRGVLAGAGSEPHKFHAWVEYDGVVINDDPAIGSKYLPFGGDVAITADPDAFD
ncbi:MAG: lasso peptide biosynthesis B2 protein, partial [Acidimicrobiia bacterium]